MADTTLRRCCVCKQEYKFCPKCPGDKHLEPWHFSFCSENCKNIYDVTSQYANGQITDTDANEQIQKLNLSQIENFGDSYKTTIAKIMEVVNEKKVINKPKEPINTVNEEKNEKKKEIKEEKSFDVKETSSADNDIDEGIIKKSRKKRISKDVE